MRVSHWRNFLFFDSKNYNNNRGGRSKTLFALSKFPLPVYIFIRCFTPRSFQTHNSHLHRSFETAFVFIFVVISTGICDHLFQNIRKKRLSYLPDRPLFGTKPEAISKMCLPHTFDVRTIDVHRMSHR